MEVPTALFHSHSLLFLEKLLKLKFVCDMDVFIVLKERLWFFSSSQRHLQAPQFSKSSCLFGSISFLWVLHWRMSLFLGGEGGVRVSYVSEL